MSRYWSDVVQQLVPYVPGEQPALAHPVKLNTNENPYPPSPRVVAAISRELGETGDTLRRYPDPLARALRETVAAHHRIKPEQIFVGNGSDEVLAHAFQALLKHDRPLRFPDISYSFYPTYARLYGIATTVVPLADADAGEVPRAFVVRKAAATPEELMAYVAEHVASYKKVRRLEFVDSIPKSPSGKILRRLLKDRPLA